MRPSTRSAYVVLSARCSYNRLTLGNPQVVVVPGDVESDAVKADGKVMVYTITTKADNEYQAGNSDICNYNILPKKIVDIL